MNKSDIMTKLHKFSSNYVCFIKFKLLENYKLKVKNRSDYNIFLMRNIFRRIPKTIKPTILPFTRVRFNFSSFIRTPMLSYKPQFNFSVDHMPHENVSKSVYEGNGFYVEQMLTGCLALYSYYIESGNECLIIDPQNDLTKYMQTLEKRGKRLKGVFLTHYHADYIAGHRDLIQKLGGEIYMGPKAVPEQHHIILKDGDIITLGDVKLKLIHTPGHTQQSSCLLLINKEGKQDCIFTGDTLFLNQVGRPDLAVKTNLTAEDLASLLYDSVQKLKSIDGQVRVYPGHGSGSSCGKNIGSGDFCTIGNQKKNNYALKASDRTQFVKQILQEMPSPPQYFGYNAKVNKFTPFTFEEAFEKANKQLTLEQVYSAMHGECATLLDVRQKNDVIKNGIIQGSIMIGFHGSFATWLGTLMDPTASYVVYGLPDQVQDTIKRMLRIGYINIVGYAKFDINDWKKKGFPTYIPDLLEVNQKQEDRYILDIRKPKEWAQGILDAPKHICYTLSDVFAKTEGLDKSKKYSIHCAGGYRAKIAYTFLKNHGYDVKTYPYSFKALAEGGVFKVKTP